MGNKHDTLTRRELDRYKLDYRIKNQLDQFLEKNPDLRGKNFHVLDWGCGRGRAVLHLLEEGFSAYGVDIDENVIKNGAPLFNEYGYDPVEHLKFVSSLADFPDGFFHFILSEQVFEHVENIQEVIQMQARLLAPGGIGCHVFPSAKMIRECHLNMPFVHWLPKHPLRKIWIAFMMLFSQKPEVSWPETKGTSFWQEVDVYYNYLNASTFYRDNRELKQLFPDYGLEADFIIKGIHSPKRKLLPDFLLYNGFPDQQVCLVVRKSKKTSINE